MMHQATPRFTDVGVEVLHPVAIVSRTNGATKATPARYLRNNEEQGRPHSFIVFQIPRGEPKAGGSAPQTATPGLGASPDRSAA